MMIKLRPIDPAKNMRRFYRLDTQPDLFGGCVSHEGMGSHWRAGLRSGHGALLITKSPNSLMRSTQSFEI